MVLLMEIVMTSMAFVPARKALLGKNVMNVHLNILVFQIAKVCFQLGTNFARITIFIPYFKFMTECACNMDGSTDNACHETNGHCECKRPGIIGDHCDTCAQGHYSFPSCHGKSNQKFLKTYLSFFFSFT